MRHTQFRKILTGLLGCLPMWCMAQSMALQAIGSSGGTAGSGGHSITWTVGESIIRNGQQADVYVGAGFQQARRKQAAVSWTVELAPLENLKIYPNPAADFLIVESEVSGLTARLYDLLGRPVLISTPLAERDQLDLSALPAGAYFLQVFDTEQRLVNISKIQHINH